MSSKNLEQSFTDSYQAFGLGGQGSRKSPPFISLSTDGLGTGSIRIEGFDKTNQGTLYSQSEILKYLQEIIETGEDLNEIAGISASTLSSAEQQELQDYSKEENTSGRFNARPIGIKVPGLSDLPPFLKTLSQMLSLSERQDIYYFPLSPGKCWYLGAQGVDFTGDNASYNLIQTRKSNDSLTICKLSEKEDGQNSLSLAEDSSWPKPLSNDFLQTFPGLKAYTNSTRNLIDPNKLITWAPSGEQSGWAALSGDSPIYKNIMGSTDTLFLADLRNKTLSIAQLLNNSASLVSGKTYTLSFYAKVLNYSVRPTPDNQFKPQNIYSDQAGLNTKSCLVAVPDQNSPVQWIGQWLGSREEDGLKKEALFYSWKRYYFTFEADQGLTLTFHAPNLIIETGGWLLEETKHPSPYDFRFLDCRSNYDSTTYKSKDPGQLLIYPLLYLLPTNPGRLSPKFQAGTFIFRQYLEDKVFLDDHLCSFGITQNKYITWGLKGRTAGIWYGDTALDTESYPVEALIAQKETWLTNVITFSLENNELSFTWILFGKEPGNALVNLSGSINIGQSELGYCSTSSQHIESALVKWSYAHFNLALGCELKAGTVPDNSDPFNQLFSVTETGFYNFSGDIFADLTFCPVVLELEQIKKLTTEILVLKDQKYLPDPNNDINAEIVMTLIASPIEQGHIQLSKVTQAYVDNNPENSSL